MSEYIRLTHLSEIGYRGGMEDLDDFTANCFVLISETLNKCRAEAARKKTPARNQPTRKN